MQLPQDLQHFPVQTLLVASDSVHAKFWLLHAEELEELPAISIPRESQQPSEGGPQDENMDAERFHRFVHEVMERITDIVQEHQIAQFHLVMPAEIEHAVMGHLPQDVIAKVQKRLHHDVMNESATEIVRRIVSGS